MSNIINYQSALYEKLLTIRTARKQAEHVGQYHMVYLYHGYEEGIETALSFISIHYYPEIDIESYRTALKEKLKTVSTLRKQAENAWQHHMDYFYQGFEEGLQMALTYISLYYYKQEDK